MADADGDNIDMADSGGEEDSGAGLYGAACGVNVIDQDDAGDAGRDDARTECLLEISKHFAGSSPP